MRRVRYLLPCLVLWGGVAAAFTLISTSDEIQLGKEIQQDVRSKVPELTDRTVASYIRDIGGQLVRHAPGHKYPYSFSVANYGDLNAFALPGGPVWINRGTIEAAQNESQLVSVVAHEIAHIAERHVAEQISRGLVAEGVLGLLGAVVGDRGAGRAAQVFARVGVGGLFLRYSRDHEREADRVGAEMMHRAGWHPRGAAEFMQTLRDAQKRDPNRVEVFLSTHPPPENRIELLEQTAGRLGGGRRDSNRFQEVRRRLAAMPPAQPMPRR
jgi:beta-barrel assembly-enhancing protease